MSDLSARQTVIESLGVYLPPGIVATSDVIAKCDKFSRFQRLTTRIENLTGITSRRLAADTESASEMAAKAIRKCLAVSRYQASDIDLLLYCGISRYASPNHYINEPALSLVLSAQFPFRNALAFDIANGCAGMFNAISIADGLIKAGLIRVALVVSGEHITDLMKTAQKEVANYSDPRFACLTLGDAAAALILSAGSEGGAGLHALELYTVAQFSEYCIAKPTEGNHGGVIMHTESARLFDVAENYVIPDTVRALDALQWGRRELNHIISHQTAQTAIDTLYMVNRLAQREILHKGNVVNNLAERGNTASTSHFVALWDMIQSGGIRSGDRALFAIQGSGMTIGTGAYTFDDLPDRIRLASRRNGHANGNGSAAASSPGRARSILRCGTPRVRIESAGIANSSGPASGMTLAQRAMDDCFARSVYTKNDIDLLIFAGVHRDEFIGEPAIAALIAGRYRINETAGFPTPGRKTFAFDVCNGSLGFLNACYLSAGMIRSGQVKSVMVVASEIEPNAGRLESDEMGIVPAGSAVILDSSADGCAGFGYGAFDSFTEHIGAYNSWLVASEGKPRMRVTRDADLEKIYLMSIPGTVEELLKCEDLRMENIKVILPPQISSCFAAQLGEALHVERDRFVDLAGDGRNLYSSSLSHSFLKLQPEGRVAAGDIGLMISVGSGLQVGVATYYF